jgi:hypothetical protein
LALRYDELLSITTCTPTSRKLYEGHNGGRPPNNASLSEDDLEAVQLVKVGRCKLEMLKAVLKVPDVSETEI